jgi:hypothetical protein
MTLHRTTAALSAAPAHGDPDKAETKSENDEFDMLVLAASPCGKVFKKWQ